MHFLLISDQSIGSHQPVTVQLQPVKLHTYSPICSEQLLIKWAVRGCDYSPTIGLSEEKDKLVTENLRQKKKSTSSPVPLYTIHQPTVHACIKFKLSILHKSWEKCDENFNIWKLERKKNEEIKGQIRSSSLIPIYMIYPPMWVPSFNLVGQTIQEKSVMKNSNVWKVERKKNEEIKGQIKSSSLIPVYSIHYTSNHFPCLYQVSNL